MEREEIMRRSASERKEKRREGILPISHRMKKGMDHQDKLISLRRIEGQIRGLQKMIAERRYCVDIINAAEAVQGALKKVEAGILKDHLNACVRTAFERDSFKEKDEKIQEIHKLFEKVRK